MVGRQILVVYEPGRRGAAALKQVRRLAPSPDDVLTVVALAPGQPFMHCVSSGGAIEAAVVDAADRDLANARRGLGALAAGATFQVLAGDAERTLRELVSGGGFDVVVAPRRRLRASTPEGDER